MVPENKYSSEQGQLPSEGQEKKLENLSSEGHQQSGQQEKAIKPKRPRGLAAADPETRRKVARKGGEAVSRNRRHMAEIGRKGGETVSQDRKHMAEIGRKGGEAVSQNREHMAEIGRKGGEARGTHLPKQSEQREEGLEGYILGSESETGLPETTQETSEEGLEKDKT